MAQALVEDPGARAAPVRRPRFASSRLRLLDLGTVPWLQSQSIHHGIAHAFDEDTPDTLVIVRPDRPYLCVGRHGLGAPLLPDAVARSGLPVVRRELGGGTVLITPEQTFFVFIVHRGRLPLPDPQAMRWCLEAGAAAYRLLGIDAAVHGTTDLRSGQRKLCGSGSATIGEAAVFGGNVIVAFDVARFVEVLRYPSRRTRELVAAEMEAQMGSVEACGAGRPDAAEVAAALRRGVETACGVELVPGELTAAEAASARRSEAWLTRWPPVPERMSKVWWKVRAGSGILHATLTRPRPCGLIVTVRDRVIAGVLGDVAADPTLVSLVSGLLVGRSLDAPPDTDAWASSGLAQDAVDELVGWLRAAAHAVT